MRRARKSERGFVLAATAIAMPALFALAAVGIDTGRVALTATEVQNVADAAASAGAKNLLAGGTASTARSDAQAVARQNGFGGLGATIETSQIEVGQYDYDTRTFVNGAIPSSAVRATPSTTVQNLFVGIFGSSFSSSTVTKTATAGFTGLGRGRATLPLAIGECNYPGLETCFADSTCLPRLENVPSPTDNVGWTAFFEGTNTPNIKSYLPSACGGSQLAPEVGVGTSISLGNGANTPVLQALKQCVDQGIKEFMVPIVSCSGQFNQSSTVTGFATIIIKHVEPNGTGAGIDLEGVFKEVVGPPGGGAFGMGMVRLLS